MAIMNKLKSPKKNKRMFSQNKSVTYAVILTVSIVLSVVFLSSNHILSTDTMIYYTAPGTVYYYDDNCSITLRKWSLSEVDRRMEILISIDDIYNAFKTKFNISGREKRMQDKPLPAQIPCYDNGLMVVIIDDIPRDFEAISFTITALAPDGTEYGSTKFYCNKLSVQKVENIQIKTWSEYAIILINEEIFNVNTRIDNLQNEIDIGIENIENVNSDIVILSARLEQMYDTDLIKTEAAINNKIAEVESLQLMIIDNEKSIEEFGLELEKLLEKRSELLK